MDELTLLGGIHISTQLLVFNGKKEILSFFFFSALPVCYQLNSTTDVTIHIRSSVYDDEVSFSSRAEKEKNSISPGEFQVIEKDKSNTCQFIFSHMGGILMIKLKEKKKKDYTEDNQAKKRKKVHVRRPLFSSSRFLITSLHRR